MSSLTTVSIYLDFQNFGKQIGAPSADFYVRMFGNELAYVSDFRLDQMIAGGGMAQLSRLGQALNNMKFENTRMMMEAIVSVPTISGFPIELSLDLASSVRMSAGMNMEKTKSGMSVMATYDPRYILSTSQSCNCRFSKQSRNLGKYSNQNPKRMGKLDNN